MRILTALACLAGATLTVPTHAQHLLAKSIAAPPADILTDIVRLPDPSTTGTPSAKLWLTCSRTRSVMAATKASGAPGSSG